MVVVERDRDEVGRLPCDSEPGEKGSEIIRIRSPHICRLISASHR
jgi:hypothetical protein